MNHKYKRCSKCKITKPLSEFYKRKENPDGHKCQCKKCHLENTHKTYINNKERWNQYRITSKKNNPEMTKEHMARYWRKMKRERPWMCHWHYAIARCGKNRIYTKKGIRISLTLEEVKKLWFRDKAWLLKRPSMDRRNTYGYYTFENCRFIELGKNISLGNIERKLARERNGGKND